MATIGFEASVFPGDRVRALDGAAGLVAQSPAAAGCLPGDFVLRLPGGELRDAPGASVIRAGGGVVWLAVSVGTLPRHPVATRPVSLAGRSA